MEKKTGPKHKAATEGGGGGHTDAIVLSLWRPSTNEEKGEPLDQSKIPDAAQRAKKREREAQAARDKTPGRGKHRSAHPGDVREAQIIGQALTRERTLTGQHSEGGGETSKGVPGLEWRSTVWKGEFCRLRAPNTLGPYPCSTNNKSVNGRCCANQEEKITPDAGCKAIVE